MTPPAVQPGPRSPAPEAPTPKLRSSCHACAASKVKCSTEKPTCSRCTKRGKKCEYLATRRAGRKQGSRLRNPQPVPDTTQDVMMTQAPTPSSRLATESLKSPTTDSIEVAFSQYSTTYPDLIFSPDHPAEPQGASGTTTTLGDIDINLDNYFASPISFQLPDLSDNGSWTGSNRDWSVNCPSLDTNITTPLFDITTQFLSPSEHQPPHLVPSHQSSSGPGQLASQDLASESDCGCQPRALELLKQLCPGVPAHCTAWPSQGTEKKPRPTGLRLIQSVIAGNEHTIESIGKMLPCPCSQDGFLLATISLAVFKVMGRYEAAAREPSTPPGCGSRVGSVDSVADDSMDQHPDSSMGSSGVISRHYINVEDSDRLAPQLVLRELYRVQRLVNGLSKRLKNMAGLDMRHDAALQNTQSRNGGQDILMGSLADSALPFSAPFFCQVESDLRKRLRALSTEVADLLRRA